MPVAFPAFSLNVRQAASVFPAMSRMAARTRASVASSERVTALRRSLIHGEAVGRRRPWG